MESLGRKTEQTYTVHVLVTFMKNVAKFQPFATAIKCPSLNSKPSDSNSWVGLLTSLCEKNESSDWSILRFALDPATKIKDSTSMRKGNKIYYVRQIWLQ